MNPFAAPAVAFGNIPAPPTLAQLKPILVDTVLKDLAPQLVHENIDAFAAELYKLRNKNDEAKKYVEKAVKDYGFSFNSMKEAKASFSQIPFHHFIVTKSPNHM